MMMISDDDDDDINITVSPDNSDLQGKKFELSRVQLCRKCSEGKWKLLRVSGRFEL